MLKTLVGSGDLLSIQVFADWFKETYYLTPTQAALLDVAIDRYSEYVDWDAEEASSNREVQG